MKLNYRIFIDRPDNGHPYLSKHGPGWASPFFSFAGHVSVIIN